MTIHRDLVGGNAIHQAAYIQTGDPGAVGAWKLWIDITDPDVPLYKYRNSDNSAWVDATAAGSGGAVVLDDLTDVDAAAPADGDVLTWDDGAGEWVPLAPSGGGGGSLPFPDDPPASPNAFDDEFTAASLDAMWTETVSPDGSFTKVPDKFGSWWGMEGTGNATARYVIRQALSGFAAGTAFQVTIKASLGWKKSPSGTPRVGVSLSDNSTFETGTFTEYLIYPNSDSIAVMEYNGSVNINDTLGVDKAGVTVFLHIQRSTGNDIRWYTSFDGITFCRLNTANRSFDFDYLYLWIDGATSSGNPGRGLVDWVRVNDARFTQPV